MSKYQIPLQLQEEVDLNGKVTYKGTYYVPNYGGEYVIQSTTKVISKKVWDATVEEHGGKIVDSDGEGLLFFGIDWAYDDILDRIELDMQAMEIAMEMQAYEY